ncbi:MAG: hypothetical protein KF819_16655 [Labilithrix sp.]|nr:hypothetical protein [Labilithrix sp.]
MTGIASRITARAVWAALLAGAVVAASVGARGGEAPRMRVETTRLSAGDHVLVHFDAPVKSNARPLWLTLVPIGSTEGFVGERVAIDEGAEEATVSAHEEGTYELRLVSASSASPAVIARVRVDVAARGVARREPPAWYW